jgi:drug/metabolite transporter (DMT)-like permease
MIVGFGVSSILHWKNLGSLVQPLYILWNQELIVFIISIAILSFSKSSVSSSIPIIRFYFPTILLMSLVILFALYFGLLGLQDTNPLISSAFALGTPLFTIFFGALYFKEKLSVTSAIAITLISIGVFWINYYGF